MRIALAIASARNENHTTTHGPAADRWATARRPGRRVWRWLALAYVADSRSASLSNKKASCDFRMPLGKKRNQWHHSLAEELQAVLGGVGSRGIRIFVDYALQCR